MPPADDPLNDIFRAPATERPRAPAQPARPATPSRTAVVSAMRAVAPAVSACTDTNGMATVRFRFASDGSVRSTTVNGDSLPGAARSCIARAARTAHVPAFARDSFSVTYPFRL